MFHTSAKHPTLILLPSEKMRDLTHLLAVNSHMDAMSWDDFNNQTEQYYKGRLSPYPVLILLPYYANRYTPPEGGQELWNKTAINALSRYLRTTKCIYLFLLPTRNFTVSPVPEDLTTFRGGVTDWQQACNSTLRHLSETLLSLTLGISASIEPTQLFESRTTFTKSVSGRIEELLKRYLDLQTEQVGLNLGDDHSADVLVSYDNREEAPCCIAHFRKGNGQACLLPLDSENLTQDHIDVLGALATKFLDSRTGQEAVVIKPSASADDQQDAELIRRVKSHLEKSQDLRMKELLKGDPDIDTLAALLAQHIKGVDGFEFRYLAPRRSRAKVFLFLPENQMPAAIKIGRVPAIISEREKYEATLVQTKIGSEIRPDLWPQQRAINDYASLRYCWTGAGKDMITLRSAFKEDPNCVDAGFITFLFREIFPWQNAKRGTNLPFDQWEWSLPARDSISETVIQWTRANGKHEECVHLLYFLSNQDDWRNPLKTQRASVATCHGDFSSNNLLLARFPTGVVPRVIDFAGITIDRHSPARDWAKLERDLKLRCLAEILHDSLIQKEIAIIDDACNYGNLPLELDLSPTTRSIDLIAAIRKLYVENLIGISEMPVIEYLYYLFCWTLAYLATPECHGSAVMISAVVSSALRTIEAMNFHLRSEENPSHYAASMEDLSRSLQD